jgi:hypothetical protein
MFFQKPINRDIPCIGGQKSIAHTQKIMAAMGHAWKEQTVAVQMPDICLIIYISVLICFTLLPYFGCLSRDTSGEFSGLPEGLREM